MADAALLLVLRAASRWMRVWPGSSGWGVWQRESAGIFSVAITSLQQDINFHDLGLAAMVTPAVGRAAARRVGLHVGHGALPGRAPRRSSAGEVPRAAAKGDLAHRGASGLVPGTPIDPPALVKRC